ncbi:MAG: hypothetical protein R3D00_25025 [Bacteroidia bacterium]
MDFSAWTVLPHTIDRGNEYFRQGRVQKLERFGNVFSAQVTGGKIYQVVIDLRIEKPSFSCNCLYDVAGPCKHVFAVSNAIHAKQFIAEYPELSYSQAAILDLVNINAVRDRVKDSLIKDNCNQADWLAEISGWLAEDNIRNAIRYLLGIYEATGNTSASKTILPEGFILCMDRIQAAISPRKLSVKNAREIMDIIFIRWDKYEQLYDYIQPGKSFRYDFELLQPLMVKLTFDKVMVHFLEMKFSGYGVDLTKLILLKNQMQKFVI